MMLVRVRWGGGTHAAVLAPPVFLGAVLFACGSGSPNTLLSGGAGGWGGGDPGTASSGSAPPPSGTSGGSGASATSSGTGSGSGSSGGSSGSTSSGTSGSGGTSSSTGASSGATSSGATGSSGGLGSGSGGPGSGSGSGGAAPDASVADSQAGDGALDGAPFTFTLIDTSIVATNGSPVPGFDPIANGARIDLAAVGDALSVRANVSQPNIADVQFDLDGRFHHTENGAPYMLCSNNGPTINNCNLGAGAHLLQATVFFQSRQGTTTGPTATIAFMIIDSSADAGTD